MASGDEKTANEARATVQIALRMGRLLLLPIETSLPAKMFPELFRDLYEPKRDARLSYSGSQSSEPPAIEGTSSTRSPSRSEQDSPPRKRISSSLRYMLRNWRICPLSS